MQREVSAEKIDKVYALELVKKRGKELVEFNEVERKKRRGYERNDHEEGVLKSEGRLHFFKHLFPPFFFPPSVGGRWPFLLPTNF